MRDETARERSNLEVWAFADDAISALDNWLERQAELQADGDETTFDLNEWTHADGAQFWTEISNRMTDRAIRSNFIVSRGKLPDSPPLHIDYPELRTG